MVAAFASDVELLLLDEPTAGLDPLMEAVFQAVLADETSRGRTVLLSSHILDQVEKLADRVTIIREGKTMESGTLDELRHLIRSTVTARTTTPVDGIEALPGVFEVTRADDSVSFTVEAAHLDDAMGFLHGRGLRTLVCHPPTLEELFLRHYGDDLAKLGNGSPE